jgi:hypothetical protein
MKIFELPRFKGGATTMGIKRCQGVLPDVEWNIVVNEKDYEKRV